MIMFGITERVNHDREEFEHVDNHHEDEKSEKEEKNGYPMGT